MWAQIEEVKLSVKKKTPRIAAWCRLAFLFNDSYSSNCVGIFRIRGLPRGRFQPTTHPRMIDPYRGPCLIKEGIQEQVFDFAVYR
jgi:hypothetical protein